MAEKYHCNCGTDTFLKKNGDSWKHSTPDGTECLERVNEELHVPVQPFEKPEPAVNNSGEPEVVLTLEQVEDLSEAADDTEDEADAQVFEWRTKVSSNNPYLNETAWLVANANLASKAAADSGVRLSEAPQLVEKIDRGEKTILVYKAAVQED